MRRVPSLLACLALFAAAVPSQAEEPARPAPLTTEQLVARERIRSAMEQAFDEYLTPTKNGEVHLDNTVRAVERLLPLGEDLLPFVATEIGLDRVNTFYFCAYLLGRLETPAAEAPLRKAIERAEAESGTFALMRKSWAAWALALRGVPEAVDLFNEGRHNAAHLSIHDGCSVLEAATVLTQPHSVPRLLGQLERWNDDPEMSLARRWTLRALRRTGDASAVPKLLPLLEDPDWGIRREAANAMRTMGGADAVRALIGMLDDEKPPLRGTAALALEQIRPDGILPTVVEQLETEDEPVTLGMLYRMLVRLNAPDRLERLNRALGDPSGRNRRSAVQALGLEGSAGAIELLGRAMEHRDNGVAVEAARQLTQLGGPEAVRQLERRVPDANHTLIPTVVDGLIELGVSSAAPLLHERLIVTELDGPVTHRVARSTVVYLSEALLRLGHAKTGPALRKAMEAQTDATLQHEMRGPLERFRVLERNGRKVGRWVKSLASQDEAERILAYRRLGALGGPVAVRALAGRFDEVEREERLVILRLLGSLDSPETRALFERVLLSEEFDRALEIRLRDMAAWGARRIGGEAMFELLRAAIERRNGREARVLIYAAALDGARAADLIERYRVPRMHYLLRTRGQEQELLDRIVRDLRRGLAPTRWDVKPELLVFR